MLGIKYPLTEVCKRSTLLGLLWLPTLCDVSLNCPDRPSFRTSPTMSFSIHLPCRSKSSLGLTVSRPSTVINYSPDLFRTSSISELLRQRDFYSNRTPSKFLRWSTTFRVSIGLLREPNFYYERSTLKFYYERSTPNSYSERSILDIYCK